MSGIIVEADTFAEVSHRGQLRKYTGEPYIVHPRAVSALVATVTDDENMIAAALLHDVIEDCGVTLAQLNQRFNYDVADLVRQLTDISLPSDGNRAFRKQIDREHLGRGSSRAKTIKLADLIDNTKSIVAHDPNFAKVYLREKELLLPFLVEGDARLFAEASALLDQHRRHI